MAEPPIQPESDSDTESPHEGDVNNVNKDTSNTDIHPTTYLKNSSVCLLRAILLSCGIEANKIQLSAIKILSSLLRGVMYTANKSDSSMQVLLAKEHEESWATLGILRAIANSQIFCRALCTPAWVNFLLNIIIIAKCVFKLFLYFDYG